MAGNIDIATLTARLALDLKNFNAGIDTAESKLGQITKGNAWSKVGESLNSVAKAATITGGAIVGAAGMAVKSAVDFESAFTGVKKTINFEGPPEKAKAFFNELHDEILKMSSDMPVAAEEIAGVMEAAGQLGIQNENLIGFTKAMIGLGSATNMSANEAAVALAQFANVTQMAQTDFDKLGSSIVELGNNMATDERQITSFATELAVLATSAGFSEADILGLGAAMASMGLESAASGTAMQRLSQDMISAVSNMSDSYEGFQYTADMTFKEFIIGWDDAGTSLDMFAYVSGMTAEEFAKAWKEDASSAFMEFIKGVGSKEVDEQLIIFDRLDIKQLREIDMLQRLAGNTDLVRAALDMANDAWGTNKALTEEVNKRNEDTASQLQMLKNDVKELAIEAGEALLPTVRDLLKQAKPLIEKAIDWIKNNPEAVVQLAKTGAGLLAIGGTVSGIIKVVTTVSGFITTLKTLGTAIGVLTGGGAAAGAAAGGGGLLAGLGAGLAAIGPAVLAVGAVVGAFALAWKKDWLNCQEHMSEAVSVFKQKRDEGAGILESFGSAAKVFFSGLWSEISSWWNSTIGPWFSNVWNHITNWFNTARNNLSGWYQNGRNNVTNFFSGVWNSATSSLSNLWNNITGWFSNARNNLSNWFTNGRNNVTNFFTNIWNTATAKVNDIKNTITNTVNNAWNSVSNIFNNVVNNVSNIFSNIWNNISNTMNNIYNTVWNAVNGVQNAIDNILGGIRNAWDSVSNFASNAWNTATSWFGGWFAEGGAITTGKAYIVGEQGPELFVPHSNGYIVDNESTMDMLSGGGDREIVININGDVYDDEISMRRKVRGAVLDVIETELAYG